MVLVCKRGSVGGCGCVCAVGICSCVCVHVFSMNAGGYVHKWGRGLGVSLRVCVSVCAEDKDLAKQAGLVDR